MVFRLLVPYHLAGVVCCQEVGTVNEEALVKDFLDLMTVLDQEEAMEIRTINIKYSVNLRGPTESVIYLFSFFRDQLDKFPLHHSPVNSAFSAH